MTEEKLQHEQPKTKGPAQRKDEGSEPIFVGGPTQNQINEWKSKFGAIYMTDVDDEIFIWRTITRLEYKDIIKLKDADAMYREERMVEKCILWPEQYDFTSMSHGKAGTPSLLAEHIMTKSGFTEVVSQKL